jgi:hypothetical protein
MIMKRCPFIYYLIFLLTVLDIVFTVKGLKLGIISEGNPILSYFMESDMGLTAFCVLAYVGAALILIYKASPKICWLNTALAGTAGVKLFTVLLHLRWISIYLTRSV